MADEERLAAERGWMDEHLRTYLATDGREGQYIDMRYLGGRERTTALLLRTIGRRSGRTLIAPLIYKDHGGEFVIVASKAGAPNHPAWFLNLTAQPETRFQIGPRKDRGGWRIAEGEERARIWAEMETYFPPYADYKTRTAREIPLVLLRPTETIDSL
jgi:deazaflavin-dependent oxidoreductase (nitroreductase family)